ncbi:hypothetical protein COT77_00235 [Candidatus Berkelbacteria bacterium CG10_big_fil_rev_8_21_14_0_10_41_12]|uniref:Uncharacterized protein n=1 Tax=Candidatus Berkelbacteria bacterium CG10_big_fil_rev_8_21_14_0_10_41_12 TaxID=1974513 RepID=A0A2M6WXY1_9BACT|nr:MAG: hypothetical protein COT77_00235 [Candidatus Berkelbacteria bacterium CG10_big_fil_rev_8_21_14_0_10_41_12]
MNLIQQIISQARNFLTCPVCHGSYGENEIRLRGYIDNIYIFQTFCSKGHEPTVVTYLASLQKTGGETRGKPQEAHFHPISQGKITDEELSQINSRIEGLTSSFEELWQSS